MKDALLLMLSWFFRWRRASPWRSGLFIRIRPSISGLQGSPRGRRPTGLHGSVRLLTLWTRTSTSCTAASLSRRAGSATTSIISARRCSSFSTARRSSRSTAGRPLLKGPAGAPCRMGHSHAIYNATDKPVQWMNINVSAMKGTYDAFNLGDARARCAARSDSGIHDHAPGSRAAAAGERHERRQRNRAVPARARYRRFSPARGPTWITWCFRRAPRRVRTCIARWPSSTT